MFSNSSNKLMSIREEPANESFNGIAGGHQVSQSHFVAADMSTPYRSNNSPFAAHSSVPALSRALYGGNNFSQSRAAVAMSTSIKKEQTDGLGADLTMTSFDDTSSKL